MLQENFTTTPQTSHFQPEDRIRMHPGWKERLKTAFSHDSMQELRKFLVEELRHGKVIYPAPKNIFRAFDETPFDAVKVVILGQDPYHGPGQAHGLSFSVPEGVPYPPSLQNIFKEISTDLQLPRPRSGDLTRWAKQGVFLLNAVLTVEQGMAASHQNRGWEKFTDEVIRVLAQEKEHVVFILWGSYAQRKGAFIDRKKHCVIESPHPSPLSAHRGFFGSKVFSKANDYLRAHGKTPIDFS